jgi:hypothetical protein
MLLVVQDLFELETLALDRLPRCPTHDPGFSRLRASPVEPIRGRIREEIEAPREEWNDCTRCLRVVRDVPVAVRLSQSPRVDGWPTGSASRASIDLAGSAGCR